MFLKRQGRHARGQTYEYWTLMRTVRTARGAIRWFRAWANSMARRCRRHAAGTISTPCWRAARAQQLELGASAPPAPQWREADVRGVRVGRLRQFGRVYLGLALWRRLGLHTLLQNLLPADEADIGWDLTACVLVLGRFCAQPSELAVVERWYDDTALEDLLGVPLDKINDTRLYRGLEARHPHKDAIGAHLLAKYRDWFGVRFDERFAERKSAAFLLYDVTSTFFEGQALRNTKAARGYSRDSRPDCKQVCIGLVVAPEGLPVACEVFASNRAEVTAVEEIVTLVEEKYGQAQCVWVLSAGARRSTWSARPRAS